MRNSSGGKMVLLFATLSMSLFLYYWCLVILFNFRFPSSSDFHALLNVQLLTMRYSRQEQPGGSARPPAGLMCEPTANCDSREHDSSYHLNRDDADDDARMMGEDYKQSSMTSASAVDVDPFDAKTLSRMIPPAPLRCHLQQPAHDWVEMRGPVAVIMSHDDGVVTEPPNSGAAAAAAAAAARAGLVVCNFSEIYRLSDWRNAQLRTETRRYPDNYSLVYSDTVRVECMHEETKKRWEEVFLTAAFRFPHVVNSTGWQYVLQQQELNNNKPVTSSSEAAGKTLPRLNVLVWILESVSKNTFIRSMRRSWRFMRTHMADGLVFHGFNAFGRHTLHALGPLFTGERFADSRLLNLTYHKGYYVEDSSTRTTVDDDNESAVFIFRQLQRRGYVTAYFEESPETDTFISLTSNRSSSSSSPGAGDGAFRDRLADHWHRPYMLERASRLGHTWPRCVHNRTMNRFAQEYLKQLWTTYSDKPKFFVYFEGLFSHEVDFHVEAVDHELKELLRWMNRGGDDDDDDGTNGLPMMMRNDSLVILMGDHGHKWSSTATTRQGLAESKTPLLFMLWPPWFRRSHRVMYDNLRHNARRGSLTTHADLHVLLRDITGVSRMSRRHHHHHRHHQSSGADGGGGGSSSAPSPPSPMLQRKLGMSLLRSRVPRTRTCASAGIPASACSRVRYQPVLPPMSSTSTKDAADVNRAAVAVVEFINSLVNRYWAEYQLASTAAAAAAAVRVGGGGGVPDEVVQHRCHNWTLSGIQSAVASGIDEDAQDVTTKTTAAFSRTIVFELVLTLNPGGAAFRVWVSKDPQQLMLHPRATTYGGPQVPLFTINKEDVVPLHEYKRRAWCINRSLTPTAVILERLCHCAPTISYRNIP